MQANPGYCTRLAATAAISIKPRVQLTFRAPGKESGHALFLLTAQRVHNSSISAMRPPCYYLLEEIVILGVIYGSLVDMRSFYLQHSEFTNSMALCSLPCIACGLPLLGWGYSARVIDTRLFSLSLSLYSPSRTHARTYAHTHARTHAHMHARTHARTQPQVMNVLDHPNVIRLFQVIDTCPYHILTPCPYDPMPRCP